MDVTKTDAFLAATKQATGRLRRARYLANVGKPVQARRALESAEREIRKARDVLRGRGLARGESRVLALRGLADGAFLLVDLGDDMFAVRRGPRGVELYDVVEG